MPTATNPLTEERTGLLSTPSVPGQSVTGYNPAASTASTAVARGYTPTSISVTDDDTVQGQLAKITASGSPLMLQAERRARESVAPRGLLNSSLAIGHAQEAVIDKALPIAQQDASTYWNTKGKNADAANAAAHMHATADNQASLTNAGLITDTNKFNAAAQNDAATQAAKDANAAALAKLDATTRTDLANLDANTRLSLAEKDAQTRLQLGQLDANTRTALAQLDATTKGALAELDAQTRLNIAQMDQNTQLQMAQLANENKSLLQANQNAANLMNSASNAIMNIAIQQHMGQEAKDNAIASQMNLLKESLRATGDIAGMNLASYFQPPGSGGTTNGPTGAGTPTPAPAPPAPTSAQNINEQLGRWRDPQSGLWVDGSGAFFDDNGNYASPGPGYTGW